MLSPSRYSSLKRAWIWGSYTQGLATPAGIWLVNLIRPLHRNRSETAPPGPARPRIAASFPRSPASLPRSPASLPRSHTLFPLLLRHSRTSSVIPAKAGILRGSIDSSRRALVRFRISANALSGMTENFSLFRASPVIPATTCVIPPRSPESFPRFLPSFPRKRESYKEASIAVIVTS